MLAIETMSNKNNGVTKMIRCIDFNKSMPMSLYQSYHTENVSLKFAFYKIAVMSNIAWHLKAKKPRKKQKDARLTKTLLFTIQKILVTVRSDEK